MRVEDVAGNIWQGEPRGGSTPPGASDSRILDSPLSARITVTRTACPTVYASVAVWSAPRPGRRVIENKHSTEIGA